MTTLSHSSHFDILSVISNPFKDLLCGTLLLDTTTINRSLDKNASPIKTSFKNILQIKQDLERIGEAQEKLQGNLSLTKAAENAVEQAKSQNVIIKIKDIPNFSLIKSKIEGQLSQLFQKKTILDGLLFSQSGADQLLVDKIDEYIKTKNIDIHEKSADLLSIIDKKYGEIKDGKSTDDFDQALSSHQNSSLEVERKFDDTHSLTEKIVSDVLSTSLYPLEDLIKNIRKETSIQLGQPLAAFSELIPPEA